MNKVDFTRTGDPQKVLDFIRSVDSKGKIMEDQERLATDAIKTIQLNSPHGITLMDAVQIGVALTKLYD